MERLQLIIDCTLDSNKKDSINNIGCVLKEIPLIDSYIIEIDKSDIKKLESIVDSKAIYQDRSITVQMDTARRIVKADVINNDGYYGEGITIAVLDTGVYPVEDLIYPSNRIIGFKDVVNNQKEPYDDNGHGTHVAGIIASNAANSNGRYLGIAPKANIVGVKILDKEGRGNVVTALNGLQWVTDNYKKYNIKIINLSIGTPDKGSVDPLVKAVEKCWDIGIAVVIAAGNNGPAKSSITSPGISRKVITVGASDDHNTVSLWGENLENYSGRGPTREYIRKPDIIAPGTNIISCLSPTNNKKSDEVTNKMFASNYIELSGTSMSTPIVSGSIALLVERYKDLKPDDIKLMLKKSARDLKYPPNHQGWGILDVEKLVKQEAVYARK